MIAFEALFTFLTAMAFITLIGRPLAKAYSEKVQALPHNMTGAEQKALLERVATLESELSEVRRSIITLQDSADFTQKMLESKNGADSLQLEQLDPIDKIKKINKVND